MLGAPRSTGCTASRAIQAEAEERAVLPAPALRRYLPGGALAHVSTVMPGSHRPLMNRGRTWTIGWPRATGLSPASEM